MKVLHCSKFSRGKLTLVQSTKDTGLWPWNTPHKKFVNIWNWIWNNNEKL